MATDTAVPQTYEEAVELLAGWHGKDTLRRDLVIYSYDGSDEVVRLLEVSPTHPATGEAWPIGFRRFQDFGFRSEIILLAARELEALDRGEIQLPEGWDAAKRRQVWLR